jgi:hypothetical protein
MTGQEGAGILGLLRFAEEGLQIKWKSAGEQRYFKI